MHHIHRAVVVGWFHSVAGGCIATCAREVRLLCRDAITTKHVNTHGWGGVMGGVSRGEAFGRVNEHLAPHLPAAPHPLLAVVVAVP